MRAAAGQPNAAESAADPSRCPWARRRAEQGTSASHTGTCSVPAPARKELGAEDAPEEMILGVVELEHPERRREGNVLHLWPDGQSSSARTSVIL